MQVDDAIPPAKLASGMMERALDDIRHMLDDDDYDDDRGLISLHVCVWMQEEEKDDGS